MFETTRHRPSAGTWLGYSLLLFFGAIVFVVLLFSLLNGTLVNRLIFPVAGFMPMFKLMWPDAPLGSLWFLSSQSLIAFAHRDPASGLVLWMVEYDTIAFFVYALAAALGGRVLAIPGLSSTTRQLAILGAALMMFGATYGQVAAHCAGATWSGYIALLAMGFDFDARPIFWPLSFGFIGVLVALVAIGRAKAEKAPL